jgi:hypothetical protein
LEFRYANKKLYEFVRATGERREKERKREKKGREGRKGKKGERRENAMQIEWTNSPTNLTFVTFATKSRFFFYI